MDTIIKQSMELGVETNKEKGVGFRAEQKYIGFIWNGESKTVRLPANKLQERIGQVQEILVPSSKFSFNNVEILAGQLNHVSYVLPQLRCYLNSLYHMLCNWQNTDATRPIPDDVRKDMEHWRITLLSFTETRLILNPQPTEIGWVGDSLTSYGIGILIGQRWAQF
jgi:hypothetical protein